MDKYLDLGVMPLANNLEFTSKLAKEKDKFPLQIMFCNDCGLSQLSVVINPSKMFSYYTYRSSINGGYVRHCNKMANELSERFGLNENSFVIDIAGNDGALLKEFKKVFNPKVLNVDPATNLTAIAEQEGVTSLAKFWGYDTCEEVVTNYGKADLITATNVFAHVDNIQEFLRSAKSTLSHKGVLVIEFPYLVDFIQNKVNEICMHLFQTPIIISLEAQNKKLFEMKEFVKKSVKKRQQIQKASYIQKLKSSN
jgi:2-polyprenyl-3-methyl-5-hydroxy-6-metoxy-1,4-benzoquinol methylase